MPKAQQELNQIQDVHDAVGVDVRRARRLVDPHGGPVARADDQVRPGVAVDVEDGDVVRPPQWSANLSGQVADVLHEGDVGRVALVVGRC